MDYGLLAVTTGLASAVCFGTSDFGGGVVSRRHDPVIVVLIGQFAGLAALLAIVFVQGEPLPPAADLLAASVAGIFGSIGVVRFYAELSRGRMGVIAPLTAVVTVTIPVLFGALTEGLPQANQLLGILLAISSIWLITRSATVGQITLRDIANVLLMGFLFSFFMIVIGTISERSVLWPLVASRIASIPVLLAIIIITKRSAASLTRDQLPMLSLIGLLDVGGSSFFALATTFGRLDVASVLTSLYPAVTALLAKTILAEDINHNQWFGIGVALSAIVLITL